MAHNERFQFSVRVLAVLASEPGVMHTSESIAGKLKKNAVMVRRAFRPLHKSGLIVQRKGPHGGAKLKISPKQIRLGDVFEATSGRWISGKGKPLAGLMEKLRADAVNAMNHHSLAQVLKKMQKQGVGSRV